ncbi:2OG-Fe(II) oxygenase [Streptomyces sp. NPDC058964]|uniref:2OG-Fe(II) oxygenase n=1 Tax=Streptomyces sp. NPDC058964 TaxID=3346681 RepID=UPI00367DC9DF
MDTTQSPVAVAGTLHSHGDRYRVYDDLLVPADFEAVAALFERLELTPRTTNKFEKLDGPSLRGRSVQRRLTAPGAADSRWENAVVARVRENFDLFRSGGEPDDQVTMVFTPWGYPGGSQLHWHRDQGSQKLGAFIYYVHRRWHASWGGALAILDAESRSAELADEEIMDSPLNPVIVMPKPNRLVLLEANTPHSIQRTDLSAEGMRCAFAGFVLASPH